MVLKFKVGDWVMWTEYEGKKHRAEVMDLSPGMGIGLRIPGFDGHSLRGLCPYKNGYWVSGNDCKILKHKDKWY